MTANKDKFEYINRLSNFDLIQSGSSIFNLLNLRNQVLENFMQAEDYNLKISFGTIEGEKVNTDFYIDNIRHINEQIKTLMCL